MKETKRLAFNFLRSYFDVLNNLKTDKDKLDFLLAVINKQFLNEDHDKLDFIPNLCYESQRHSIEKSVKGWIRANNGNPPSDPIGNPPYSVGSHPKEVQEKGEEKGEEKEKQKNAIAFSFTKELISLGVEEQIVKDWLKVRRKKKATDSITSLNAIKKQIEVSGKSANECIKICVEKDWKGFSAEWLKEKSSFKSNEKYPISLKTPKFNEIEDEM